MSSPPATRRCSARPTISNTWSRTRTPRWWALFIETIRQPDRFVAALDRAAALGKPVVVLKVGPERAHAARHADAYRRRGRRTRRGLGAAARASRDRGRGPRRDDRGAGRLPERATTGRAAHRGHHLVRRAGRADPGHRRAGRPVGCRRCRAARADIVGRIGPITGDGNPLDAWGSGTFTANLPQALSLFDASPDHDIVVFCRDNFDDQPFDTPESAADLSRPVRRGGADGAESRIICCTRGRGSWTGQLVAHCASTGLPRSAACARG